MIEAEPQMDAGSDSDANNQKALEDRLIALVTRSAPTMQALSAARGLGLPSWCIGAGAIRNLVWDHLHSFETPAPSSDVDLVFFDPNERTSPDEQAVEAALLKVAPQHRWEVVNQAFVHRWLQAQHTDRTVSRFLSLEEGVGSWPEIATCVGVALNGAGGIEVIAPHGLSDLFDMMVRPNPACVSREAFSARVKAKRWELRWPKVTVP